MALRGRSDPAEGEVLLERTLTTPDRWEDATLDLSAHAGRSVTLALNLQSKDAGALGFWGGPAIRNRTRLSPAATESPVTETMTTVPRAIGSSDWNSRRRPRIV